MTPDQLKMYVVYSVQLPLITKRNLARVYGSHTGGMVQALRPAGKGPGDRIAFPWGK